MNPSLSDDEIETFKIGGPRDPNIRALKESFGRLGAPSELRPSTRRAMDRKLCTILGIDDPKTFLEQDWEQRPRLMRRGSGVFRKLFSIQILDHLIATRRLPWDGVYLKDVTGREAGERELSSFDRVPSLRDTSIAVKGMEACWSPLRELHDLGERSFDRPMTSVAFLTPPGGGQHFELHWDIYDLFILQVSGSKRWQVYKPLISLPADNHEFFNYAFEGRRPQLEVELEEGDVLYVPRGFLHQARTGSNHSLHVTLGLGTVSWHHVIGRAWRRTLGAELTTPQGVQLPLQDGVRAEARIERIFAALRRTDHAELAQDETFFPATRPPLPRANYQRGNVLMYRTAVKRERGHARASYTSRGRRYVIRKSATGTLLVFDERKVEVPKDSFRELTYVLKHRSFCPADRPAGVHSGRLARLADELTDAGFLRRHITWERA